MKSLYKKVTAIVDDNQIHKNLLSEGIRTNIGDKPTKIRIMNSDMTKARMILKGLGIISTEGAGRLLFNSICYELARLRGYVSPQAVAVNYLKFVNDLRYNKTALRMFVKNFKED